MNKSAVVEWWDDVNAESYVLCLKPYGIQCLNAKPIDDETSELVVYGPTENVDKFLEDFEDGNLEPLDTVQSGDYDDEDYEAWLNNEVNAFFKAQEMAY